MASLRIDQETRSGTLILSLDGQINAHTALELRQRLDDAGQREVIVDFSRVREFRDVAVAVVTQAMHGRQVQLRGLGAHHERMFGYFGFPVRPATERAWYQPEEMALA